MDLLKVNAIVEAEGFFIRKNFYIREIAIVNEKVRICQEFDLNVYWETLEEEDQRSAYTLTNLIHGLTLNPKSPQLAIKHDNLKTYTQQIYDLLYDENRPFWGCKNPHLGVVLEEFGIPLLDLRDPEFNCPSFKTLDINQMNPCPLHLKPRLTNYKNKRRKYLCELKKGHLLWEWLTTTEITQKPEIITNAQNQVEETIV